MRRFADQTAVPIAKSRTEIDALLRGWGAIGIQWSDDFEEGRVMLRFIWPYEGNRYIARMTLQLATDEALKKLAIDGRTRRFSAAKFAKLSAQRGRQEHRVLGLWLKAALNAVAAKLITAEELFLPFLEGNDGKTVAELALPRLHELFSGSATKLLGTGR